MGLDMYLEGKCYIGGEFNEKEQEITIIEKASWDKEEQKHVFNVKDITYVIVKLAYWRKANAIHRWFVDNCWKRNYDDYQGENIYVSGEQLIELKELCKKVLELLKDKSYEEKKKIISENLPMQDGFFFGYSESEEGIEGYIEDLEDTIKQIDDAIKKCEKYGVESIFYNASW